MPILCIRPKTDSESGLWLTTEASEAIRLAAFASQPPWQFSGRNCGDGPRAWATTNHRINRNTVMNEGMEIGGFLTGTCADDAELIIEGIEMAPSQHRYGPRYQLSPEESESLRFKQNQLSAVAGKQVLGFFRTCTGEFTAGPQDAELGKILFESSIPLLLVKPFPEGHCGVRVFKAEIGGWIQCRDVSIGSDSLTTVGGPQRRTQPEPCSRIGAPEGGEKIPWAWAAGLFLFIFLLAGLVIAWLNQRARPSSIEASARPAEQSAAGPLLGMKVEMTQGALRVSWNRETPILLGVREGLLSIEDGEQRRQVHLDESDVSGGSILYRPASGAVTFRLAVYAASGSEVSETVRVIDGSKAGASALSSQPAPPVFAERAPPQPTHTQVPDAQNAQPLQATMAVSRTTSVVRKPIDAAPAQPAHVDASPTNAVQSEQKKSSPAKIRTFDVGTLPTRVATVPGPNADPPAIAAQVTSAVPLMPLSISIAPPPLSATAIADARHPMQVGGVIPPRPIRQVMPSAHVFGRPLVYDRTDIEVQVSVDVNGRVTDAKPIGSKGNQLFYADAMAAARQWIFTPARVGPKNVPSSFIIVFHFEPSR